MANDMNLASIEDFNRLDIRVGEIVRCEEFPEARRPAYKLWVDFGGELGVKASSAQITDFYKPGDLPGRKVLGIVNFAPRRVAGFESQVLVLGVYAQGGVAAMDARMRRANTIIFLDFNRFTCLGRGVKRRIANIGVDKACRPDGCPGKLDCTVIKWVWNFKGKQAVEIHEKLKAYGDKNILVLSNPGKVRTFMKSICD